MLSSMTTPRIEEVVKKETDEILSLVQPGVPFKTRHPQRDKIERRLERALTEAHQAGRDEAVEKIVNTIASKPYAFDLAEERLQVLQAIKALQNNK